MDSVRRTLLVLAALAEDQLRRALAAFFAGDVASARLVIAADRDVDALELRVDDAATMALAAGAHREHEMRVVVAAMKIATVLERIGDEAVGIARAPAPQAAPTPIAELARHARSMLSDASEALIRSDTALARRVLGDAEKTRSLGERAARRLMDGPLADPEKLSDAFHGQEVVRRLLRIAEHSASIAGMVIFASSTAREPEGNAA
jgi:phosphate transport system protein